MSQNNPQPQNGQQVQIKAKDEVLAGKYSNMVQISHSKEEFIFDFVNLVPPSGQLVSRVIVSPAHAKRMIVALEDNIKKYESQFDKIEAADTDKPSFGFQTN